MKTLREVLLHKHEHVEPELDRIRRQVIGELRSVTRVKREAAETREPATATWKELFSGIPFWRGQLVTVAAVWLLSACLNLYCAREEPVGSAGPRPAQLLSIASENRKQLLALIQMTSEESATTAQPTLPRPRSDARFPTRTI